jgi:hypothetical protein
MLLLFIQNLRWITLLSNPSTGTFLPN